MLYLYETGIYWEGIPPSLEPETENIDTSSRPTITLYYATLTYNMWGDVAYSHYGHVTPFEHTTS